MSRYQAASRSVGSGLGPVGGAGLVENAGDVICDGSRADEERFPNPLVSPARSDKSQYLYLSRSQTVRVDWGLADSRAGLLLPGNDPLYQPTHPQFGSYGQGFFQQGYNIL